MNTSIKSLLVVTLIGLGVESIKVIKDKIQQHAGKAKGIFGPISNELFPRLGAVFVNNKHQGPYAKIAHKVPESFHNALSNWINAKYEKANAYVHEENEYDEL